MADNRSHRETMPEVSLARAMPPTAFLPERSCAKVFGKLGLRRKASLTLASLGDSIRNLQALITLGVMEAKGAKSILTIRQICIPVMFRPL